METNKRDAYRVWFDRMVSNESIETMTEAHTHVTDAAFALIESHGEDYVRNRALDHDANLLLQMTALKSKSIKTISVQRDHYIAADRTTVRGINDPFGMLCLVRSQMEAFCTFNNIYVNSDSDDERQLKYDLWVLAGLTYRQRFRVEMPEHVAKKEKEAKEIEEIREAVKQSPIYKALSNYGRKIFDQMIKGKDWKFRVQSETIRTLQWHDALTDAGANDMLDQKYTFLSLASHPSNVSVFQFGQMYVKEEHRFTAQMAMLYSGIFLSFLIRDYVIYFNLQDTHFKSLPLQNQMLVNWYNRAFRGKEYQVNDALSLLD